MKKRTPIFKLGSLTDLNKKQNIQKSLYNHILSEVKANVSSSKKSIVIAHIQDNKDYYDITLDREDFKSNLMTIMSYHEVQEDYEKCSEIQSIISKLQ